jgi:peroxiredoxin family protein
MGDEKKGLAIIFHSGSYDRLHHGLSIALAALALGREVRCFFTYWALDYLRKNRLSPLVLEEDGGADMEILRRHLKKGDLEGFSEWIQQTKRLGAKIFACTNSMSLLNISRDELTPEVDKSTGLTTFLKETAEDQILFI